MSATTGATKRTGASDEQIEAGAKRYFVVYENSDPDAYREWEARLTRDFLGLTWRLSYLDTDLSQAECASSYGFDDVCSATVVAAVSKHF